MSFTEIFCNSCKKTIARYNTKYYSAQKIDEIVQTLHVLHTRAGHEIVLKQNK